MRKRILAGLLLLCLSDAVARLVRGEYIDAAFAAFFAVILIIVMVRQDEA